MEIGRLRRRNDTNTGLLAFEGYGYMAYRWHSAQLHGMEYEWMGGNDTNRRMDRLQSSNCWTVSPEPTNDVVDFGLLQYSE